MTDLDPEIKARIEAEERYRAQVRGQSLSFTLTMGFGLLAGVLIVLGAFLPVATVPIYGAVNLMSRGAGDGAIILGLGVLMIIFSFLPRFRLVLTGLGLVTLLVVLLDFKAVQALQAGEFGSTVQIGFGWAALGLGVLAALIAPILKE